MRTFHLQVVGLGNVQQIVPLRYLEIRSLAIFVDKRDIDPGSPISTSLQTNLIPSIQYSLLARLWWRQIPMLRSGSRRERPHRIHPRPP